MPVSFFETEDFVCVIKKLKKHKQVFMMYKHGTWGHSQTQLVLGYDSLFFCSPFDIEDLIVLHDDSLNHYL